MGSTIVAQRQVAEKQLAEWKERRTARLSQVEELQVCSLSACNETACIVPLQASVKDIDITKLEWEAQRRFCPSQSNARSSTDASG